MFIFNHTGAVMMIIALTAGFSVGGGVSLIAKNDRLPVALGPLAALSLGTGLDVWYRWTKHWEYGWIRWFHPGTGGMFAFIPIWVWFGAVPVVGSAVAIIRKQLGLQ